MDQFFLRQKIAILKRQFDAETDKRSRRMFELELLTAERELALNDSAFSGIRAHRYLRPFRLDQARRDNRLAARFQREFEASPHPYMIIDPRPGLHIVDVNDAYAAVTMTHRDRIAGERVFDVFPDNPADPLADGVRNVYASLEIAAHTIREDAMGLQRYDVRNPAGQFVKRYWRVVNASIRDRKGQLQYLLLRSDDVTAEVAAG